LTSRKEANAVKDIVMLLVACGVTLLVAHGYYTRQKRNSSRETDRMALAIAREVLSGMAWGTEKNVTALASEEGRHDLVRKVASLFSESKLFLTDVSAVAGSLRKAVAMLEALGEKYSAAALATARGHESEYLRLSDEADAYLRSLIE
jgi:hypothetical protein